MMLEHDPAAFAARAGGMFRLDPAAWPTWAAAWRPGMSARELAEATGKTRMSVYGWARYHGVELRKENHGSKPGERRRDYSAMLASVREHGVAETARRFGVTRQRVSQVVLRHEKECGERLPRWMRGRPITPRVEQMCATGCGAMRSVTPGVAKRGPWRCPACGPAGSRIPNRAMLQDVINRRVSGEPWIQIALGLGIAKHASAMVPRTVFLRLQKMGEDELIGKLWPKGLPRWLRRYERGM